MSELQDFRDRCAKAMGMVRSSPTGSFWHGPDCIEVSVERWRPDIDYNQAHMMLRRAVETNAGRFEVGAWLFNELSPLDDDGWWGQWFGGRTALQLAEAALEALEKDNGTQRTGSLFSASTPRI